MSVAKWDEYRAALRDHRSWPATIALFLIGTVAWFILLGFASWAYLHLGSALLPLAAVGGVWVVWSDAAHRLAGRRIRQR